MKIKITFDKHSIAWERHKPADNQMFVTMQIRWLVEMYLKAGYLYFESVYGAFGMTWDPYDENKCWIHERDGELKFNVLSESSSDKIEITIRN